MVKVGKAPLGVAITLLREPIRRAKSVFSADDDMSCARWHRGEGVWLHMWTLVEPILLMGGVDSKMLWHRPSNRDILGFCLLFFLTGSPPSIHRHTQTPNTLGLQRQSDRTATLHIRVRSVEHVVCHINSSCRGNFGKLAASRSQPIAAFGYEACTVKFNNDNGHVNFRWTVFSSTREGSEGRWSSVRLISFFFSVSFCCLD